MRWLRVSRRRSSRLLSGDRRAAPEGCFESAAPVQLPGLLVRQAHRVSVGAARPWASALESGHVRTATSHWPLYFGTGRRCGDSMIDRMTGTGRQQPAAMHPRVSAIRRKATVRIHQVVRVYLLRTPGTRLGLRPKDGRAQHAPWPCGSEAESFSSVTEQRLKTCSI